MADNTGLPSTYSACCRLCLSEKVDVLKGLFDDDESRCIQQKILSSLGIEVTVDDKLSTVVCDPCIDKLNDWNLYKQTCAENQLKLEHLLLQFNNISNNEIIPELNIQIKEEPIDDDVIMPDVTCGGGLNGVVLVKSELMMDVDEFPPTLTPQPHQLMVEAADETDNAGESSSSSNPRKCTICDKVFSSSGNRRKHERVIHGIIYNNNAMTSSMSESDVGSLLSQDDRSQGSSIDESAIVDQQQQQHRLALLPPSQLLLNPDEVTDEQTEHEKILFAAGLKLLQRNSNTPPLMLLNIPVATTSNIITAPDENLSKIEYSYAEKCKAMVGMYNTLRCACHNVLHPNLKGLLSHLRSLRIWFPVFTCYHCMITFTDRSSSTRHHLNKCTKKSLDTLKRLANLRTRSDVKTRLYQNYKCSKCKFMYSFHEDYCAHINEDHLSGIILPKQCTCGRLFTTLEDYKNHIYISCMVDYYCDICFVTVKTLEEFQKHAVELHDSSEGFVLLQDDNYRKRKSWPLSGTSTTTTKPPRAPKRETLDNSAIILTGKRRSSYYNRAPIIDDGNDDDLLETTKGRTTKVINPLNVTNMPPVLGTTCPICAKQYSSNFNMLRHYRSHLEKIKSAPQSKDEPPPPIVKIEPSSQQYHDDSLYCCPDCGGMFSSSEWTKHKELMHKKVGCTECGKVFQFQSELDQHRSVHLNLKVYRDSKTQAYKSTSMKLMMSPTNSMDSNASEIVMMCEICDKIFKSKDDLKQHKLSHELLSINTTTSNDVDVDESSNDNNAASPQKHQLIDRFNKKFICLLCNKHYAGYSGLWEHNHKKHPNLVGAGRSRNFPKQCKHCDKIFHTGGSYFMHKQMHERLLGETTVVQTTPASIKQPRSLLKAIKIKKDLDAVNYKDDDYDDDDDDNNESYHTCKRCFKVFSTKYNLKNHMKSHGIHLVSSPPSSGGVGSGTGSKKTKRVWCNVCHSPFDSPGDLEQHKIDEHDMGGVIEEANSPVMPILTKITDIVAANNTATTNNNYNQSSSQPYIFTCNICVQTFTTKFALKKHKENHMKENYFTNRRRTTDNIYCRYCKIAFDNLRQLNKHMLMEHDEDKQQHEQLGKKSSSSHKSKRYQCTICGKRFPSNTALCTHQGWHKRGNKKFEQNLLETSILVPKQEPASSNNDEDEYQCQTCQLTYPTDTALQIHILEKHRNVNATIVTSKSLAPRPEINDNNDDDNEYNDDDDNDVEEEEDNKHYINNKSVIISQQQLIRSQKKYQCRFCTAAYNEIESFNVHLKQYHSQDREGVVSGGSRSGRGFKCPDCNRVFNRQNSLSNHIKVHKFPRYTNNTANSRAMAMTNAANAAAVAAAAAAASATNNSDHNSGRKFTCSICNVGFDLPKDLRAHTIQAHPF